MGRGRSKISSGNGSGKAATVPVGTPLPVTKAAGTPSGVTHDQFMKMTMDERYSLMHKIVSDQSIRVPSHLDSSTTTKIMYALGMNNKPTVVPDSQIDGMKGRAVYRTVYDAPGATANDIIDQIRSGDYTQLSGKGGSAYGRALYFAASYRESSMYSSGPSSRMCRGKIDPKANIVEFSTLTSQMRAAGVSYSTDNIAMFAIANGIDGWYERRSKYRMILNRGVLTMSDKSKKVSWGGSWDTSSDG